MKSVHKYLVCLDLSYHDRFIIDYAAFLSQPISGVKKMILLHNIRHDFLGEEISLGREDLKQLQNNICKKISEQYGPKLKKINADVEVVVTHASNTAEAILATAGQQDADLLLMGKKDESEGTGVIPQRVLNTDKKSIPLLLIPEKASHQLKRILSPVAMAKRDEKVLEVAQAWGGTSDSKQTCLYVYNLPVTYFPYMEEDHHEIAKRIKDWATRQFKQYQTDVALNPDTWTFDILQGPQISDSILSYARDRSMNLIVMGRISQTSLLSGRTGGTARRILRKIRKTPVLLI